MKDKSELRCWVCKRNADEVERDLKQLHSLFGWAEIDMERIRTSLPNFAGGIGLIRLVGTEGTHLSHVPLCLVCQGVILNLGRDVSRNEIERQRDGGELMPYTEYEIKVKE